MLVMRLQSRVFSLVLEAELDHSETEMKPWEVQLQAAPAITLLE